MSNNSIIQEYVPVVASDRKFVILLSALHHVRDGIRTSFHGEHAALTRDTFLHHETRSAGYYLEGIVQR